MGLNLVRGNMYSFCTHTWNAIKGKCSFSCDYCYMKRFPQNDLRFDEKELKTNLGEGNFIFVGSSCDMFADDIPEEWILRVLIHCKKYNKNKYLFQTKNPKRLVGFSRYDLGELNIIFGTTIETNRETPQSKAPSTEQRAYHMTEFYPFTKKMVTIEPIMDFDLDVMVKWMKKIKPEFVNIGADSGGNKLPEPPKEKIEQLIKELEKFTKVNLKDNLKRLMK